MQNKAKSKCSHVSISCLLSHSKLLTCTTANVAHLIRHKVSSQVTANEIYVSVVQLKNETWVAITVHQLMEQRVVIVSSKVATANDPIARLTAIATDAVKVTMESFIPDEEVTGRLLTEANVAKANVRRI